MKRHERMEAACRDRRARTAGKCEREDCNGIGWCGYVYETIKPKSKGRKND